MGEQMLDFDILREKWREVPQGTGRTYSDELLLLDQTAFLHVWQGYFDLRLKADRWYQTLYREFMRDKAVLEIGSGLGFDGVMFLREGVKQWTFCDIANSNLNVIRRVCDALHLQGNFVFIDDKFECFDKLGKFDVIWANGSLINVPFEFARAESLRILPHLKPGGRWIELCYPRERWIREGRLPFTEWGKVTDGERTPWVEWYDLVKLKRRLFPAPLEVVLDFNFSNDAMNWFDLVLPIDRPFDPRLRVFDLEFFPAGHAVEAHGDSIITVIDDGIGVITPEDLWSYAASFDLGPAIARSNIDAPVQADDGFTIELEIRVTDGYIGILIVGDDISVPVCQESMAQANSEPTTLMIEVPPRAGASRLIFRNTASGKRSQFTLTRVTLRFVGAE